MGSTMKTHHYVTSLVLLMLIDLGVSAQAADRVRAGQWVGTTLVGGNQNYGERLGGVFTAGYWLNGGQSVQATGDDHSARDLQAH